MRLLTKRAFPSFSIRKAFWGVIAAWVCFVCVAADTALSAHPGDKATLDPAAAAMNVVPAVCKNPRLVTSDDLLMVLSLTGTPFTSGTLPVPRHGPPTMPNHPPPVNQGIPRFFHRINAYDLYGGIAYAKSWRVG